MSRRSQRNLGIVGISALVVGVGALVYYDKDLREGIIDIFKGMREGVVDTYIDFEKKVTGAYPSLNLMGGAVVESPVVQDAFENLPYANFDASVLINGENKRVKISPAANQFTVFLYGADGGVLVFDTNDNKGNLESLTDFTTAVEKTGYPVSLEGDSLTKAQSGLDAILGAVNQAYTTNVELSFCHAVEGVFKAGDKCVASSTYPSAKFEDLLSSARLVTNPIDSSSTYEGDFTELNVKLKYRQRSDETGVYDSVDITYGYVLSLTVIPGETLVVSQASFKDGEKIPFHMYGDPKTKFQYLESAAVEDMATFFAGYVFDNLVTQATAKREELEKVEQLRIDAHTKRVAGELEDLLH